MAAAQNYCIFWNNMKDIVSLLSGRVFESLVTAFALVCSDSWLWWQEGCQIKTTGTLLAQPLEKADIFKFNGGHKMMLFVWNI